MAKLSGYRKLVKWVRVGDDFIKGSTETRAESVMMDNEGTTLVEEIEDLKKSVSDGKTEVATAITEKKVQTATDASFDTMAANIRKIKVGSGNATKPDVLKGKTFTNKDGVEYEGTMTNNGEKTATLNCGGSYTIPEGYHNGSGKVTANSLASQTSGTATAKDIFKGKTAYVDGVKVTGTGIQNPNAIDTVIKGGISASAGNFQPTLTSGTSSFTISSNRGGYGSGVEIYSNCNYIVDDYTKLKINFSHFYMPNEHPKLKVYFSESTHTDAGSGDYSRYYLGEVESVGTKEFDISGMSGVYHIVFVSALGGGDDSTNNTPVKYTISQLEFS